MLKHETKEELDEFLDLVLSKGESDFKWIGLNDADQEDWDYIHDLRHYDHRLESKLLEIEIELIEIEEKEF